MGGNQSKLDKELNKEFKSEIPWYFQPKPHKIIVRTCPSIRNGIDDYLKKHSEMNESDAINSIMAKGLGLK